MPHLSTFTPDVVQLAWAAGFCDGEGSFCWWQETRRPWLRRVRAVVPQAADRDALPEVLCRFHSAVGGIGSIGRPYLDRRTDTLMFDWATDSFEGTQAVLALLGDGSVPSSAGRV